MNRLLAIVLLLFLASPATAEMQTLKCFEENGTPFGEVRLDIEERFLAHKPAGKDARENAPAQIIEVSGQWIWAVGGFSHFREIWTMNRKTGMFWLAGVGAFAVPECVECGLKPKTFGHEGYCVNAGL